MVLALCLVLLGVRGSAQAQGAGAGLDAPYVAPKLMFGYGGEQNIDLPIDITTSASVLAADDLEPTLGVGIAYMHPVHELFAIGGQLSVLWWISSSAADDDQARDLCAALSALPQLSFDLLASLEAYLSVPFGLTLDVAGDDLPRPDVGAALARRGDIGTGVGYHAGALLGARVALSGGFGVLAEAGLLFHRFVQPIEVVQLPLSPGAPTVSLDMDISLLQGAFNVGVYF